MTEGQLFIFRHCLNFGGRDQQVLDPQIPSLEGLLDINEAVKSPGQIGDPSLTWTTAHVKRLPLKSAEQLDLNLSSQCKIPMRSMYELSLSNLMLLIPTCCTANIEFINHSFTFSRLALRLLCQDWPSPAWAPSQPSTPSPPAILPDPIRHRAQESLVLEQSSSRLTYAEP